MKIHELTPIFSKYLPGVSDMESGILYISEYFKVSKHPCACGCGEQCILPFNTPSEWTMTNNDGKVSFTPSIGNFSGENPYHAHYHITENKIAWC